MKLIKNKLVVWVLLVVIVLAALGYIVDLKTLYKNGLQQSRYLQAVWASYNFGISASVPIDFRISESDAMPQVFVPAGKFIMGANDAEMQVSFPAHIVYIDAFWIDQMEVSNAQYNQCVSAGVCKKPAYSGEYAYYAEAAYNNYPVVFITWEEAKEYCEWTGRRLPTEAEWEKAARGVDGRSHPWGETAPDISLLNFDNNIGAPMPVDRYQAGASPFGALNMNGNVREWVTDWYSQGYYKNQLARTNPQGPEGPNSQSKKSLRGGGFADDARESRIFTRFAHVPWSAGWVRGFRCVSSR